MLLDSGGILRYRLMPTAEGQGLTVRKRLQGDLFSLTHDCPGRTMRAA